MSSSYSPNTSSQPPTGLPNPNPNQQSWGQWSDNIFDEEKKVFNDNVPLVISTALATAIYSYSMIDGSTNNAINRALLMALSTFVSASAVNMLEKNGYVGNNNRQYVEGSLIPLCYYYITKKQFQLPDMQSQAIKTGVISAVVGVLANPTVTSYYDSWGQPVPSAPTTST
jgi:hypothetical protein